MPKRIVLLADGTWNDPAQRILGVPCSTNVVSLARAILPRGIDGTVQVVLYQNGVGARATPWAHLTGGAFGVGLSQEIQDLYLSLAANYEEGDEVWMFGFSRGAYTVRSLAGLVRNCGVLRRKDLTRYLEAYSLYRNRSKESHPRSAVAHEFRSQFSWPPFRIRFVGVWDTVGALGIPLTPLLAPLQSWSASHFQFHDTDLSTQVEIACQALAIDEHRPSFSPTLWRKQKDAPPEQLLEQAWFPGDHCDVGGGHTDRTLADCALVWMWKHADHAGLALERDQKPVPDATGKLHAMLPLFWPLGFSTRAIGETNPDGREHISAVALARMERVKGYAPRNLRAFRAQIPTAIKPQGSP